MSDMPAWIASYGQLGAMVWLVFEVRDMRRWFKTHIDIYHQEPVSRLHHGKNP